jgi:predicted DNA-binding transcriptional regulator AlpA
MRNKVPAIAKKWLVFPEALEFMGMSKNTFLKLAAEKRLTVSAIGQKKYFRVNELEKVIEDHIIINQ